MKSNNCRWDSCILGAVDCEFLERTLDGDAVSKAAEIVAAAMPRKLGAGLC
jgi:hypothetical protein